MLDVYIQTHDVPGLVSACLHLACINKASDIHIEPIQQGWCIRQRIDGLLRPMTNLPQGLGQALVVRIKLLSQLDIGEARKPQDGSFQQHIGGQQLDIRCSTLPGHLGEKVVLRVQFHDQDPMCLSDIGLSQQQQKILENYLAKPQGLIMVTGPTGAGKSITLHAALQHLLQPTRNVMSVEDPVEIVVSGMHQVAPQPHIGVDFANVLRALLRQDPDVLMLGELRDSDSADMVIKAAQTGHLLLTSMHTNTAAEAVSRCYGLGVDMAGLSYCLQLVINQRLVRRLCRYCKVPFSTEDREVLKSAVWEQAITEYQHQFGSIDPSTAQGCQYCHGGYRGRMGVFEMWEVQDSHRSLIAQQQFPSVEVEQSLRFQAMQRVLSGHTSIAEVARVLV